MGNNQQRLVIGVSHSMCYLDDVIRFLRDEKIEGRNVMLELAEHKVPSEPQRDEPGFFTKLKDFVLEYGGNIVYGEDEEILERTLRRNIELCEKMRKPGISIEEWADLHAQNRYEIPHLERDPHFLMVVQEQNPDVVVLGRHHIPYLIRNHYSMISVPHREVYIPENE
jgi:hypothetical protein